MPPTDSILSLTHENRSFTPSKKFQSQALIPSQSEYEELYRESIDHPDLFWPKMAQVLTWFKPWEKLLEWNCPFARWFIGGELNLSYNCIDRHIEGTRHNKAAIIWEGEPGETCTLTYQELHTEVCRFANALKAQGVQKEDTVIIYMPLVPQAAIAMLACARIGAVHSVVFGGFSAEALKDRIIDCKAKIVITADGGYRRGQIIPLKENVDRAVENLADVKRVVVFQRTRQPVSMGTRDIWWHDLMQGVSRNCPPEKLESEHPLFILYTSGSTGKPKGILHTTAGYLLGCHLTTQYVFDIKEEDIFWCTADVGWITGHSYTIYGALSNGATTFMYEGAPNWPEPDRFWKLIEKYKINIFYTAPTAIRSFMRWGDEWIKKHNLSSLRLLGSVGEPINPEAWIWYHQVVGNEACPIVDTWWQTETGSHMITTLPGAVKTKPGSAGLPFFGVEAAVVDASGNEVPPNQGGKLILRRPWPSMLRGIYGDEERYRVQYWSEFEGAYFTGDGARRDPDGYFWIVGRIDDVLNVAGHRIGTAEIESALVSHPEVAEAAVVGKPDAIKGESIVAFVTLKLNSNRAAKTAQAASPHSDNSTNNSIETEKLKHALREHVVEQIGAIARPEQIRLTEALPKTRSGKIMRRLLRQIASDGKTYGDISTLEDFTVVANLAAQEES